MPARPNRALQARSADRLRASLAREEMSGLPVVGALSDDDQRELREMSGGRLAAIAFRVEWFIDGALYPRALHQVGWVVMRGVARRIDEHVRRTDLLGALREDTLVLFAPGLDAVTGRGLADRLGALVAGLQVEVGDLHVQLRVHLGVSARSAASPVGWTAQTLAEEADRAASDLPPSAVVA